MAPAIDRPIGKLFSEVYGPRREPSEDDDRFRRIVAAAITDSMQEVRHLSDQFATFLERFEGHTLPHYYASGTNKKIYQWGQFISSLTTIELLDLITMYCEGLFRRNLNDNAKKLIDTLSYGLERRNLNYEIDEKGGIHYKIDYQFQKTKEHTSIVLKTSNLEAAKAEADAAFEALTAIHPDPKLAVIRMFQAAENVFKIIFDTNKNLAEKSVLEVVGPILQKHFNVAGSPLNQSMMRYHQSFGKWADACHPFRHGHGSEAHFEVPVFHAIALVTEGADHIRWMVGLNMHLSSKLV